MFARVHHARARSPTRAPGSLRRRVVRGRLCDRTYTALTQPYQLPLELSSYPLSRRRPTTPFTSVVPCRSVVARLLGRLVGTPRQVFHLPALATSVLSCPSGEYLQVVRVDPPVGMDHRSMPWSGAGAGCARAVVKRQVAPRQPPASNFGACFPGSRFGGPLSPRRRTALGPAASRTPRLAGRLPPVVPSDAPYASSMGPV